MTGPRAQRGAAVIVALLAVAVAVSMVGSAFWRQNVMFRQVENERSFAQVDWLMRAAVDWARLVLAEDARTSSVDHAGEPWALRIAETRVDTDAEGVAAYVEGGMQDAQSKYNLANLAQAGLALPAERACLRRLFAGTGVPLTLVEPIAAYVVQASAIDPAIGAGSGAHLLYTLDDLREIPGLSSEHLRQLRQHLTVLPKPTAVNANTASAEVLAALLPDLALSAARRLVASREQAYFKDLNDVLTRLPGAPLVASGAKLAVGTRFFLLDGRASYAKARLHMQALLERDDEHVTVVWRRELP